jgi:hypothetical protein
MAKLTKQAAILEHLHALVNKEAGLAQTDVSGKPGVDTKVTSVSDETETTDKNGVGADKQNDKQKYEQKPATDESTPLANVKTSEDLAKLGNDILSSITEKIKAADAQTNISGKPGVDTKVTSISDSTETTDKNSIGPEKQNDKQNYEQKPSTDSSEPVKAKKAEEDAVKVASYNLGASFCEALVKRASEIKQAQDSANRVEMLKQAGRRDFEVIIANAAEQLKVAAAQEELVLQKAAQLGADAFEEIFKQAQYEAAQEEIKALRAKIAQYAEIEKEAEARYNEQRQQEEHVKLAAFITDSIKRELSSVPVK